MLGGDDLDGRLGRRLGRVHDRRVHDRSRGGAGRAAAGGGHGDVLGDRVSVLGRDGHLGVDRAL